MVPKLDRLARSVPDARAIGDDLAARGIKLSLGGQVYDPTDPMGKMFFNILATFAEFEVDLLRLRTREGMAIARAKGRLKGRQPKLTLKQQKELRRMHGTGDYTISDLAELFKVSRPTVYRTLQSQKPTPPPAVDTSPDFRRVATAIPNPQLRPSLCTLGQPAACLAARVSFESEACLGRSARQERSWVQRWTWSVTSCLRPLSS